MISSGDFGSVNPINAAGTLFSTYPTVNYPASSPWVTAVGGTSLNADTSGNYQSEVVWNDNYVANSNCAAAVAGGGGVSHQFAEPAWQHVLPASSQRLLHEHRGLPDISYNADVCTAILVYLSFPGASAGYYYIGGTSEGSPQSKLARSCAGESLAGGLIRAIILPKEAWSQAGAAAWDYPSAACRASP